jgi:hypothetical protein
MVLDKDNLAHVANFLERQKNLKGEVTWELFPAPDLQIPLGWP